MAGRDEGTRVLVVDDEPVVRQTLSVALEGDGFVVDAVETAEAALPLLAGQRYAVLLLDKNLPGLSGIDLARRVRATDAAVGLLVMTAFGSARTALDGLHVGIDGYLEKPFSDIFALVDVVRDTAERARQRRRAGRLAPVVDHFARANAALQAARGGGALVWLVATGREAEGRWLVEQAERAGDRATLVVSARAALAHLAGSQVDLLFVDLALGGGDPFDWLATMRAAAPNAACAVLSDDPTLAAVSRLIRMEVSAVLEPPLERPVMVQRLAGLLARVREQRAAEGGRG